MPERGVKYAAFPIRQGEQDRLVLAGAIRRWIRVRRCKQIYVLRRPPEAVVEFILGVHPFERQSLHDGMRWIAGRDYERMPFPVMSPRTWFLFHYQFSVPPP